jgi:uncharacterized cupin superfamily protein
MISYLKFLKYFFLQKKIFERYISLNNIVGFIYIYIYIAEVEPGTEKKLWELK